MLNPHTRRREDQAEARVSCWKSSGRLGCADEVYRKGRKGYIWFLRQTMKVGLMSSHSNRSQPFWDESSLCLTLCWTEPSPSVWKVGCMYAWIAELPPASPFIPVLIPPLLATIKHRCGQFWVLHAHVLNWTRSVIKTKKETMGSKRLVPQSWYTTQIYRSLHRALMIGCWREDIHG